MERLQIIKTDFGVIEYWHTAKLAMHFPLHFHDYWLMGFLEEGSHHVFLQGEEFVLEKDCLFLLNAGEVHRCIGVAKGIWHGVHLHRGFVRQFHSTGNKLFNVNIIKELEVILQLREILAGFTKNESFAAARLKEFIKFICVTQKADMKENRKNVLSYNKNLNLEYASLAGFSNEAGLSAYRFIHKFTERYGISPHKFIINMRLIQARKLLARGCGQLEAAISGGFYDQPHFNKIFRKNFGYTPGFYQEAEKGGCCKKDNA